MLLIRLILAPESILQLISDGWRVRVCAFRCVRACVREPLSAFDKILACQRKSTVMDKNGRALLC